MTLMRVIFTFIIIITAVFMMPAATLDIIDTAAEQFGSFITGKVGDEEGRSISINPFLSDRSGQNLLGERIRSSLELYLALHYQKTRVLNSPEGSNHYTVTGEIMSFLSQVRILVKIYNPDGSLAGGIKYDLEIDTELEQLLVPREEKMGSQSTPDPFEPDDLSGFEVKVEERKLSTYGRFLTPGDIDRFLFYLPSPGKIIIEAVAETDLQLLLFRGDEEIPFMAQPSRIEEHLPSGVYILEITAYDFDLETAYQLWINLATIGDDDYEPDDTMEEATEIVSGRSQERIIAAGNYDWVELKSSLPGFYLLSAEDSDIQLKLALFDNQEREIINNYSYAGHEQTSIPVFLGTRRLFVMISAQEPDEAAAYRLILDNIEPAQIHPNGNKIFLKSQDDPHYLKLRILQQGVYRIEAESERYPVIIRVYNLPNMKSIEQKTAAAYPLTPGDYLIELSMSGEGGESIQVSVTP